MIDMLIICWIIQNGEIREAWRLEKKTEIQHCLTMNRIFSSGGKAGVITVRCGEGK